MVKALDKPTLIDASSCPYGGSASSTSSTTSSSSSTSSSVRNSKQKRGSYYPDRPSLLMQLFQTVILFAILYGLASVASEPLQKLLKHAEKALEDAKIVAHQVWEFLVEIFKDEEPQYCKKRKPPLFLFSKKVLCDNAGQQNLLETFRQWFGANDVLFWDSLFTYIWFPSVILTVVGLVLDLMCSTEANQGSPILMAPIIFHCVAYTMISIHAQKTGVLSPKIYMSFNTTLIGEKIFRLPEIVNMTFFHIGVCDVGGSYVMMLDFYKRVSSRRMLYRVIVAILVAASVMTGLKVFLVYLLLRHTIFQSAKIQKDTNRSNSFERELDYLMDPIPRGKGLLNGWVRSVTSPLRLPIFFVAIAAGVARFFVMLGAYLLYVVFFCLPVSAVFFSLRRSWKLFRRQPVQGALYTPFETVNDNFPRAVLSSKAVIIVSAHLRLICFKNRSNLLFNALFGWWLRKFLEIAVMYEFVAPFKHDFSPYVSFLMEEFGTVFPMGEGLGFGTYEDVKTIVENPNQRKGNLSLAFPISSSQYNWSKNAMTSLPETQIEEQVVSQGREIIREWTREVRDKLRDEQVQKRLDSILPYANQSGEMVDQKLVEISFGSTFFHLLCEGEFTESERKSYSKLVRMPLPFMSDWINKVFFGGIGEYLGMNDYDTMRRAVLRYLEAPSFQRALSLSEKNNWDAWTPPEVVRFLVFKFAIAGGAAPAKALGNIVKQLFDDPDLLEKYNERKDSFEKQQFILEMMRLERGVPLVNFVANDFHLPEHGRFVRIFDEMIEVTDGTPLHCSIQNANRDVSVFGAKADQHNFDRDPSDLGKMITFNGNWNGIDGGNSPPRRCPGAHIAVEIIEFLVDRFKPREVVLDNLDEIQRDESPFMKFVLTMGRRNYAKNNTYFSHASDVKHPLDTNGLSLGSEKIVASGERYIPVNDEDVAPKESYKDSVTELVLKMVAIEDSEGEWENVEEAIAWRKQWFSSNFPPVNIDYNINCSSSLTDMCKLVSRLAFSSICCLHTQTLSSLPESNVARQMCQDERAIYVNDNTALGSFRVRRGYERYGAAAYFDKDFKLVGVYCCCDNKYHKFLDEWVDMQHHSSSEDSHLELPECSDLCHAMWVWRVSALAQVTVQDHLVNLHMIASNSLVSASRLHLPIDHPLRSFLKIFTFRTIAINAKAYKTLIRPNGVVNRNWAFEGDDLQEMVMNTPNTFKKNFMDYIPESMRDVDEYPANQDLTQFCNAVHELVHDFLWIVYGDNSVTRKIHQRGSVDGVSSRINQRKIKHADGLGETRLQRNLDNDPALQAFLVGLAKGLGLVASSDLASFDDIVHVLTSLICNVTGMHELVGQISDYFVHPKICGTTLRKGKEIDSIQMYKLNCTLVSSTGLRMPRLMGNWEHLLSRNRFADQTIPVMREFQKNLKQLSVDIEARNRDRESTTGFTMESFDPVNMESSVSV